MAIIILGIGIISLSINSIGNRIVQNSLNHDFRYEQAIKVMEDHVVIGGYSDIGRRIAPYLHSWGIPLVIVDTEMGNIQAARDDDYVAIQGDISNPRELRKLNLEYARGLILAIEDPNITLMAAKSAQVINSQLWIVSEAEVGVSAGMYRRAGISAAVDRFAETKIKIRGILWGLEIKSYDFFMPDSIAFFSIPNFQLLKPEDLAKLDFEVLGLIDNNEFFPYKGNELLFKYADYLMVAGPSSRTTDLSNALKSHIPADKDGVRRVMLVGYGKYAKTLLSSAMRNADEVYVVDPDDEARKEAKKAGGAKVDVKGKVTRSMLEVMDIIILTSRAAGSMISLTLQAKELNSDVKIYARASITDHIDVFEAAGAEYVFSPEVDCAATLSSKVIEYEFKAQAIPFKNGQLLFHSGDIRIPGTEERKVIASYRAKDNKTVYNGKLRRGPKNFNLEFVRFRK
jgi:Trk K+ transport system NAD-binding subunit